MYKFLALMTVTVFTIPLIVKADLMKDLPKVELHLHLGGSFPFDYVLSVASNNQREELISQFKEISEGLDYSTAFKVFPMISQIVNTEDKVEKGTAALCKWLAKDNVVYAEVRTGLKNLGNGYEEYLLSVLRGMSTCASEHVTARLLLSLQRSSSLEVAKLTVDLALKYKKQGIVGLDLSGDSTLGNLDVIASELVRAKQNNLFLTVHVGESPQEKQQLKLLKQLKPDRIGHGVHLSKEAKDWIVHEKIPVEVCLSSSQQVKMVERYEEHPGFEFYNNNHPIVLATDDPLIFNTTLSDEFRLFQKATNATDEEIKRLNEESFNFAFVSEQEKLEIKSRF